MSVTDEEVTPPPQDQPELENLMVLLVDLTQASARTRSESQQAAAMDLLREVESDLGLSGIVPPPRGS